MEFDKAGRLAITNEKRQELGDKYKAALGRAPPDLILCEIERMGKTFGNPEVPILQMAAALSSLISKDKVSGDSGSREV